MLIAGVDEAGRGSLISRVYAAAVILPDEFMEEAHDEAILIRDSKTMSAAQRVKARRFIETNAISCCVAWAESREIDEMNILNATLLSMKRALDGLDLCPDKIMVDGCVFHGYRDTHGEAVPHECIVKGDALIPAIACAGILAKTHRDEFIQALVAREACLQPYHIDKNMGYGTAEHVRALRDYGPTIFHRTSFHVRGAQKRLLTPRPVVS